MHLSIIDDKNENLKSTYDNTFIFKERMRNDLEKIIRMVNIQRIISNETW